MRPVLFVARGLRVAFLLAQQSLLWLVGWVWLLVTLRGLARRQAWFAARVLALFRGLGATYIKVGQIMSTRPDLLPPHVIGALEKLQDQVGAFAFAEVEATFLADFGKTPDQVFASFEREPIASASVAQVHRATLADGSEVAVKVRRPGLEQLVAFDLAIMRGFARLLALIPSIRLLAPVGQVDEFGRAVRQQIDLTTEAASNARFRENFADDPDIEFPTLVPALCSARVLTMSFIDGSKLLEYDPAVSDPKRLARVGFRCLLRMVFEHGFVHADLHPGNIFVTRDDQVVILDLGLTAVLDDFHRRWFARYFAAWASGDGKTMARIMVDLSPTPESCKDYKSFEADVVALVGRYYGKPLGEVEVSKVAFEMMAILRRRRVRVNATFTMCNIAIAVTEGIGKQLAPELDLITEALPFFARLQSRAAI